MGNWTVYLTNDEEAKVKRLIAEGKYRSVYSFMRYAVRSLITSLEKGNDQKKDYWWREDKK